MKMEGEDRERLGLQHHHRKPFKLMVKKAMPPEVQKRLDNVVGLMKISAHNLAKIKTDLVRMVGYTENKSCHTFGMAK